MSLDRRSFTTFLAGLPLGETRQHTPAVMLNILGDSWHGTHHEEAPDWTRVLQHREAKLHLYGKSQAQPGRKMGHVTRFEYDGLHRLKRVTDSAPFVNQFEETFYARARTDQPLVGIQ